MNTKTKRIAVIGSTGSIGRQTLEIVRAQPERFNVVALAAGRNLELLAEQIKEFQPDRVSCLCMHKEDVRARLNAPQCEFLPQEDIVTLKDVDIVVMAVSGAAGLDATLAAVRAGKTIALANKESLVAAGEIITAEMKKSGAKILPVDSEHSAIWQCLQGEKTKASRIILTASGGPFRRYSIKRMAAVTAAEALHHPTWKMGAKVTIDSATLMNKGLEIIEAHWLFNMPVEKITVLVHPQSIIHSMVEFADGSVKAQLGCPEMRLPIQYALSYPERIGNKNLPRLDWNKMKDFTFEQPDTKKFPCLRLAIEAGKQGGTAPAVLCAADEAAVDLFLSGRVEFCDIPRLVSRTLKKHHKVNHPAIEDILAADKWAREKVLELVKEEGK